MSGASVRLVEESDWGGPDVVEADVAAGSEEEARRLGLAAAREAGWRVRTGGRVAPDPGRPGRWTVRLHARWAG